jgi:hypothetical protein
MYLTFEKMRLLFSNSSLAPAILKWIIPGKSAFRTIGYFLISRAGESQAIRKLKNMFLMKGSSLCDESIDLRIAKMKRASTCKIIFLTDRLG